MGSRVCLSVGLRFALAMMADVLTLKADLVESMLTKLYESLKLAPARSLYSNHVNSIETDTALDEARDFLLDMSNNPNLADNLRVLCVKTLVRLGLARANPEDLLAVVNFIHKHPSLPYDLRDEVNEFAGNSLSSKS